MRRQEFAPARGRERAWSPCGRRQATPSFGKRAPTGLSMTARSCPWISPAAAKSFCFCVVRSEEHTSELQSRLHLVCRLLLENNKHLGVDTLGYPSLQGMLRAARGNPADFCHACFCGHHSTETLGDVQRARHASPLLEAVPIR